MSVFFNFKDKSMKKNKGKDEVKPKTSHKAEDTVEKVAYFNFLRLLLGLVE